MVCIFCQCEIRSERAKEHILPRWLLDEFGFGKDQVLPTHFSETGDVISDRLHGLEDLLAGRVCKSCNNGWMSELEIQNKRLITSLARGQIDTLDLTDNEAMGLARWTFKTSLCLHSSSNYRRVIPSSHYAYARTHKDSLPPGVYVVGKKWPLAEGWRWVQSTSWFVNQNYGEIGASDMVLLKESSYKICLQFLDLLLLVAYNPLNNARVVLWKYVHVPRTRVVDQ